MKIDIRKSAKGEFGKLLSNYIIEHDKSILNAAEKIGLHPYIVSKHIRMFVRPTYTSIILYSNYLMMPPGKIANMVDADWRSIEIKQSKNFIRQKYGV